MSKTIIIILMTAFTFGCQSDTKSNNDVNKLINTWRYGNTIETVTYKEDGLAYVTGEKEHQYKWKMDEVEKKLVTTDEFSTTNYSYQFMGNDTLILKVDQLVDKEGDEKVIFRGREFMMLRVK